MSSRALRKAQREREQKEAEQDVQGSASEESSDGAEIPQISKKSAFAVLNEAADEDNDELDDENELHSDENENEESNVQTSTSKTKAPPSNRSKKKKKKRGKANGVAAPEKIIASTDMDDIDAALKSLAMQPSAIPRQQQSSTVDPEVAQANALLSIDTQHLHVVNEMKRLFGREAVSSINREQDEAAAANRRRAAEEEGGIPIGEAVSGRYSVGGPGLPAMARKRNLFVQGNEDWPKATGGGLGMETVSKSDTSVEYRFTHNIQYQATQNEFNSAVATMDASALVHMVRMNPWHVASLLQVSEVLKQQGDHSISGELIERALFAFGRAAHHSFGTSLSQGKARLDYKRPENREFFLASSRYMTNLRMRGTWRTAYEWARMVYSLDPENDPYGMRLVLDQYAMRAKQYQSLIDMATAPFFRRTWTSHLNLMYSAGLARCLLDKQAGKSLDRMNAHPFEWACSTWPFVAARLYSELDLGHPPNTLWGKFPEDALEKLRLEYYIAYSLDIWRNAEAKELLKYCTARFTTTGKTPLQPSSGEISDSEARHIILTDKRELITLLPPEVLNKVGPSSDPLPPDDNIASYTLRSTDQSLSHEEVLHLFDGMFGPDEDYDMQTSPADLLQSDPLKFIQWTHFMLRMINLGDMLPTILRGRRWIPPSEAEVRDLFSQWQLDDVYLLPRVRFAHLPVRGMRHRITNLGQILEALGGLPDKGLTIDEDNAAWIDQYGWVEVKLAVEPGHEEMRALARELAGNAVDEEPPTG